MDALGEVVILFIAVNVSGGGRRLALWLVPDTNSNNNGLGAALHKFINDFSLNRINQICVVTTPYRPLSGYQGRPSTPRGSLLI